MNILYKLSIAARKPIIKIVHKPTPVTYIGAGQSKKAGALLSMMGAGKTLLITDRVLRKLGLADGIAESIAQAGIECVIYDGVTPDPTFAVVDEAQESCAGCDSIAAVGGGSVMDTAKAVGAAVSNGKSAQKLAGMLKVRKPLPIFIAVPTTAGTGSETTVAAVISDTATHAKKQILDPKTVPAAAILDPELTVGLPPAATAQTALDALTHALEAYVSGYADHNTDKYAEISVKLVYENLPKVLERPDDLAAREALLIASFYGGMAFTRTFVGYVHAFAHTIGAMFNVPHGLANAVLLPHIMQYYLPVCENEFSLLAKLTGQYKESAGPGENAAAFVGSLFELNKASGIPERFDSFPESAIVSVVKKAFRECHGIYPVPRYFTRKSASELLRKVCSEG